MVKQLKEGSGNARVKELFDRVNELDYWDEDTYREIWKIAAETNKDPKFTELMNWYFDSLGKKFDAKSGKWLGSEDDNYKSDIKKYDYIVGNFEKVMDRAARILGYYFDEDTNLYITKHAKYGKKKGTVKEKYRDYGYREITDERDLYYLDNIDDICKEQLPAYSRSLMIAAHNDDYDGIQHWSRAIFDLAQNLQELCGDLEELGESVKNPKKKEIKEHYPSSTDNRLIRDILWDIENSGDQRKIEKAFDLVHQYCDNIDEVFDGDTYNIDQAIWGFGTDYIIEELQWVRDEY